ncbi:hypothetical protein H9Y04_11985 [Streptomyces sp. TRM66268-LWL]|uniref:Uncharacterized protein n=1 Tax=Streptomyces polyasparticus TaxID=2767826 RepID=A0ABR7SFY8_9ACTN|nr:hypothetical protein [Streptomyces polyasparticus]MBC9713288.1 hypothetical protein [Streptomyces polyasparticus]
MNGAEAREERTEPAGPDPVAAGHRKGPRRRGEELRGPAGRLRGDAPALLRHGAKSLSGLFGEAVRGLMAESLTGPFART